MGGSESKEPPAPTGPPPLMGKPWRSHIEWDDLNRKQLLEGINTFKVKGGVKYLNCLLLGQAASGKTSFFNTSYTALKDEGRIISPLTVFKSSGSSVTTKFETHPLHTKRNKALQLRIFDCRGLHDIQGVTAEDINLIVDGHVKHGYQINPVSSISHKDVHYRKTPKLKDMMHCVVYVVNAENPAAALAGEAAEEIFRDIRAKLGERRVRQLVLMNKVDRLRASLADDISDLFRSVEVKKKLYAVAKFMNLPEMHVLPMSNYHTEPVPTRDKDVLALTNLKTIMDCANDFVHDACDKNTPSKFYK
ncbi:interferon-induced protein 44-like [Ostrea edulis]|uniref:interferon-induced protein 44-like n=1 Tax=Ostrea edulis TaxID=37623 RepID=UPI0024AEB54D|nr:interferon-induced protein 44-like [Ostrea edulis]XP_048765778.2 interferon-induced protein 44-like [Ostrea edulis]XP_048765779.2 interferon-induced protein 44-like [Ostrea edulis]